MRNWIGSKLLFSAFTASSPCFAGDACRTFNSNFVIMGWTESTPKVILLYRYEDGGQSSTPAPSAPLEYKITTFQNANGSIDLVISPAIKSIYALDTHSNYKLVIDSRIEYFISEIKSSNLPRVGCPIDSAKVNQCVTRAGKFVVFPSNCRP